MKKSPAVVALMAILIWLIVDSPFYAESNPVNARTVAENAATTVITETQTLTSVFSYTITSSSTTATTTTTITTATHTSVTTYTLTTTTTTTGTSTFWRTQTSTSTVTRTSTSTSFLTSSTTVTLTNTSTLLYPSVFVTSMSASYRNTTIFSPTVTVTFTETSLIPTTSTVTAAQATTTTTIATLVIARPCAIASAVYGSELAPEVQILREFRDRTVMSTFAGSQFMRVFNAFYYSFSPTVARATLANPAVGFLVRALISPLIATLRISSWVPRLPPLNSELTTLLGGVLASSLVGLIYVTPFAFFMMIRKKTRNAHDP